MNNEDKIIYELLDNLIKYPTNPGEIHIWFGGYKRDEESLFGATVRCESCDIQMALDYAIPPPSWVK